MFWILFKKHLTYFKRNWKGTLLQILLPLILYGVLAWLSTIIALENHSETSYPRIPFPSKNFINYDPE